MLGKFLSAGLIMAALAGPASAGVAGVDPAAEADSETGIRVPAGFASTVFADGIGRARHMAEADNGWLYVALAQAQDGYGAVALKDNDGDGKADERQYFAEGITGTGMGIHDGYLYYGKNTGIIRWPLPESGAPMGAPEVIVDGMPDERQHAAKPFTFDGKGNLYVNIGAPSNACMREMRKKGSPGMDPCPILENFAGVWKFDAAKPSQTQADGVRYATGIRNAMALDWNMAAGDLYVAQHGRDQLASFFPDMFTVEMNAELPSEEFHRVSEGANVGWPYSYWDHLQGKRMLMPEYGGDGKQTSDRGQDPVVGFPGHWAPNDLTFLRGEGWPEGYRHGAMIAFHGSWNRAPMPQQGYRVVFVPMDADGSLAGDWITFADGFPGKETLMSPRNAAHRPTGVAEGADGGLFISSLMSGGRIYKVTYEGK
jgi:glucose/arabinose dehydrogenase